MIPQTEHDKLIEAIDQDAMLADARSWSAVNTGTANLEGLSKMAGMLADAFSTLPGEIELMLGSASDDIRARTGFVISGTANGDIAPAAIATDISVGEGA